VETKANSMYINHGSDNTAVRVLGEVENIVDDEVWYFALGALIHRVLLPNWWLSRQAEPSSLQFGVALGNGWSVK
jgi:hypothetical protein